MRRPALLLVPAAAALLYLLLPRTTPTPPPLLALSGPTMGGTWSLKLPRPPKSTPLDQLNDDISALLRKLESQMSTYRPDSDLSRFNASRSTDWQPVPRELAEVVSLAQRVSRETDGAFDVTVAPLVTLWGFGAGRAAVPTTAPADADVAQTLARVGHRHLHARLDPPALEKDRSDLAIDLGAIAKGYAADAVGALLESRGVADYLAQVGGETRARGRSHLARPWHVGIETPTPDVRRVLATVALADASLSTSGDYRNFFTDPAGQRFAHVLDPRTGRPARTAAAVSVIHPDGAYADAMATALLVLGPDAGLTVAKKLDLAVMFVTRGAGRFEAVSTPEFDRHVLNSAATATTGRKGD